MEIKININKKHLYIFSAIVGILMGFLVVNAYSPTGTGGTPSNFGHSVDEIDWNHAIQKLSIGSVPIIPRPLYVQASSGPSHTAAILNPNGYGVVLGSPDAIDFGSIEAVKITAGGLNFRDLILNKDGGNVGIGTGNPQAKLDVAGTLRFDGITLSHFTGSNPSCPTGIFLIRKWNAKTCTDSTCSTIGMCTIGSEWSSSPSVCIYNTYRVGFGCYTTLCSTDTWTEAICIS